MQKYPGTRFKTVLAVVLAVGGVACAPQRPWASPFRCADCSSGPSMTVENGHTLDMRISLLRHGTRIPLGRVGSLSARPLVLPPVAFVPGGHIQFLAEPIPSGPAHRSVEVLLSPGQRVVFTIAPNLKLSRIHVR